MTIDKMREIKEKRGYSFEKLSEYSGVPAITLRKIFSGATKAPRQATLDAIQRVLEADENIYTGKAHEYGQKSLEAPEDSRYLREDGPVYGIKNDGAQIRTYSDKRRGDYTLEDYYALPSDVRAELINGEIFIMDAPYVVHQDISAYVHMAIFGYIRTNKADCKVFGAPICVQLDMDDKTMVEPDVVVVCDRDKITSKYICGAPDFVLEVISGSTKRKDMLLKSYKYLEAGVREYWIMDPDKRTLTKYDFQKDETTPQIKALKGEEPVEIFEGGLKIDLGEIEGIIREYKVVISNEIYSDLKEEDVRKYY